jgi:hypothetical protein
MMISMAPLLMIIHVMILMLSHDDRGSRYVTVSIWVCCLAFFKPVRATEPAVTGRAAPAQLLAVLCAARVAEAGAAAQAMMVYISAGLRPEDQAKVRWPLRPLWRPF